MSALDFAFGLSAEGLHCFPCRENKQPACPHGFKDAVAGETEVRDLWHRYPGALIGIATGEISGIDALDIDRKHPEAVAWWTENRHRVPETRTHRTKSGGLHLLFRHAPELRCWTARPVVGIDGRADGGYCIWWPAAGLPVLRDTPPAEWPGWLLDQVMPKPSGPISIWSPETISGNADRYAEAALNNAVERVSRAGEGVRNSTLNEEAFSLGRLVEAGALAGQAVADALASAGLMAGLSPHEVETTLRSAFRARGLA
jgi:hypothetical protein